MWVTLKYDFYQHKQNSVQDLSKSYLWSFDSFYSEMHDLILWERNKKIIFCMLEEL